MNRFYDTLAIVAVILTPVAMMTAFGWTAYSAVLNETGVQALALVSGIATAAAVETIGIVAGETALWFHGRRDRRWMTAALILALYVAFGMVVLRETALALLPIMAGSVYVLVGLRAQAARELTVENGRAATLLEWQQEQWRIKQNDRTAIKLAELAQSGHRASTERAQSQHRAGTRANNAGANLQPCKQLTPIGGIARDFQTKPIDGIHEVDTA